jgi:SOS-response transcriptional repressor LexA
LPNDTKASLRDNPRIMKDDFLQRLDEAAAAKGMSDRQLAFLAGRSDSLIRDLRRRGKVGPTIEAVEAIAAGLEVSPAWLAFGIPGSNIKGTANAATTGFNVKAIPLVGTVSGGVWREVDSLDQDEKPASLFQADPRWPADRQFALRVEGESINRIARDGDLIAVVAVEALEKPPANGALVIVEESRDDGALIRTTAKRLHVRGKLTELHADSDDPRWRDVRLIIEPDTDDARLITTRIVGLVTAVHKALA